MRQRGRLNKTLGDCVKEDAPVWKNMEKENPGATIS